MYHFGALHFQLIERRGLAQGYIAQVLVLTAGLDHNHGAAETGLVDFDSQGGFAVGLQSEYTVLSGGSTTQLFVTLIKYAHGICNNSVGAV